MGCPCETVLYARDEPQAQRGFSLVRKEVRRLDRKYSHYRADSGLARLVRQAGQPGGVRSDSETAALLDYSDRQYRVSGGRFDITARRLTRLWDQSEGMPGRTAIERALERTGWGRVKWDGKRLVLPPGFELDLGGVVKEYAADRAACLLRQAGFRHGYVDLGGDFHVIGPHPDGEPWRIGIRNPDRSGRASAAVAVRSGGLASSGDYERFREFDGVRYSHFIDPVSGWALKADPGLAAVSVMAPSCLLAGSVASMAMLFRGRRGGRFLRRSGLAWLALDGSGNASYASPAPAESLVK
jgi:thiamine biosynthesis lipoprotein